MKVKELIVNLQKLNNESNIFLQNFMMCDNFEIHQITHGDINILNKWIDKTNIWDYYIAENEEWLNENS